MSSAAGPCQANSIPSDLAIPKNVSSAVIPGSDATDQWMVNCCHPNPVTVINTCWEWCELPDAVTSKSTNESDWIADFGDCLRRNHRNLNESNALSVAAAEKKSAAGHVSLSKMVMAGLMTFALSASWAL